MKIEAPLSLHSEIILPEWIDYNGHMNLAYYVLIFDNATDAFLDFIGLNESYRATSQSSTFAAEIHVTYEKEVRQGDDVRVTTQLLGFDEKRIHYFHQMFHQTEGFLVATNELISLHMDMQQRRVAAMADHIRGKLALIASAHEGLPVPVQAGRTISLRGKS